MNHHRFVIGIRFNQKLFRLSSLGGIVIDEILKLRGNNKYIDTTYFTKIGSSSDGTISITDENDENTLSIHNDQITFKKTSQSETSSISVERTIEVFKLLWNTANKILDFPETRRIGFFSEYQIKENSPNSAGIQLARSLTKFNTPESSNSFKLSFEDRKLTSDGKKADSSTDEFWNVIMNFSTKDLEMNSSKKIEPFHVSIDVQRYFNPAKRDPIGELKNFHKQYIKEKSGFKEKLIELELIKK